MTIITPKAQETSNGSLLNAYKTKEEVEKLYLHSDSINKKAVEKLPQPTGWRMLVLPYSGPKQTKGGLVYSDITHERIQMTTVCALVLKMGSLCYSDKDKFGEVRILNDDEVIAKISNPEDILHTY